MSDDKLTMLWLGAFRYYCGRVTADVGSFANMLICEWPSMPAQLKEFIKRDLDREFRRDDEVRANRPNSLVLPLGHDCDRAEWERVRALWK